METQKKYMPKISQMVDKPILMYQSRLSTALRSINASLFLSAVDYLARKSEDDEEWTPVTLREMWYLTNLSRFRQNTAIDVLLDLKLIEVKVKGMPGRRFVKINYKRLADYLTNGFATLERGYYSDIVRKINY